MELTAPSVNENMDCRIDFYLDFYCNLALCSRVVIVGRRGVLTEEKEARRALKKVLTAPIIKLF